MLLIEWRNESGGRHLVTQISEADMRLRDHVRPRLCGIPLFFAIGLIYVLSGASPFGARLLCWTFMLARIAHTYCYQNHIQPWRAVSFIVGATATVLMVLRILINVL